MSLITFMQMMIQHHYELSIEELFDLEFICDDGTLETTTNHQLMLKAGILN